MKKEFETRLTFIWIFNILLMQYFKIMENTLPIQQMMLRKLVSLLGENVMEIHTSLKSISDREMRIILKSQILTTVEKKRSNLEALIEDTFSYA